MSTAEFFRSCASYLDLMSAVDERPLSPASAAFGRASCGAAPEPGDEKLLAQMVVGKRGWPTSPPNLIVRASGRASAKTTDAAWLSVFHGLCIDHDRHALEGTRIYNLHIAPRRQQAAEALLIIRSVLNRCRQLGVEYSITGERSDDVELVITAPRGRCERVIRIVSVDSAGGARGVATCFIHLLEFGHGYSGSTHVRQDRAVVQAAFGRLPQFSRSQAIAESTPGPSSNQFAEWLIKPPPDSLAVAQSSFFFNPTLTDAETRKWLPDARMWRQEIQVRAPDGSVYFGHSGDSFLDPEPLGASLDLTGEWTDRAFGPQESIVAADAAQLSDYFALVKASPVRVDIAPGKSIKHTCVTHAEHHKGSRTNPIRLDAMARRMIALADGCPIVFDQFLAVELKAKLHAAGYREVKKLTDLRRGKFTQMSMAAAAQTARFISLREVAHGDRLHVTTAGAGRAVVDELSGLRAHELAQGLLRIEGAGTPDDLADAAALANEVCQNGSLVVRDSSGARVDLRMQGGGIVPGEGYRAGRARWVTTHPSGRTTVSKIPPSDDPRYARQWAAHCREQLALGYSTPAILAWAESQRTGE